MWNSTSVFIAVSAFLQLKKASRGFPGKPKPTVPSRLLLQPSKYNNNYINATTFNRIHPTVLNVHFLVVFLSSPFSSRFHLPSSLPLSAWRIGWTIGRVSKSPPVGHVVHFLERRSYYLNNLDSARLPEVRRHLGRSDAKEWMSAWFLQPDNDIH